MMTMSILHISILKLVLGSSLPKNLARIPIQHCALEKLQYLQSQMKCMAHEKLPRREYQTFFQRKLIQQKNPVLILHQFLRFKDCWLVLKTSDQYFAHYFVKIQYFHGNNLEPLLLLLSSLLQIVYSVYMQLYNSYDLQQMNFGRLHCQIIFFQISLLFSSLIFRTLNVLIYSPSHNADQTPPKDQAPCSHFLTLLVLCIHIIKNVPVQHISTDASNYQFCCCQQSSVYEQKLISLQM
eukprot:TRINITY_DN27238_c0_g2_i3.p2 TRINITY_DN27238_c0_g2~~TRINITY_DN27238_c0_g2_i3.p2  ORF type:complete len:238 (+),score=-15.39 TRINITY_DN27238_c0_g2_i3:364-1077(+)